MIKKTREKSELKATRATRVLLKMLALGTQDINTGNIKPIEEVVQRLRAKSH